MATESKRYTDIVFSGAPGPKGGRFVEVEDADENSVGCFGTWLKREDGFWVLRVPGSPSTLAAAEDMRAALESALALLSVNNGCGCGFNLHYGDACKPDCAAALARAALAKAGA